ncbi:Mitochondrial oxaloacetate carrier protein [Saitoella coloradoensis]
MSQISADKDIPFTKAAIAPPPTQISHLGSFIAGGLAACGAVTVTNPAELAKTRLQLQGELAKGGQVKKIYTGVFQAIGTIFKHEGIRGLQRGLGTAYVYQIALNGCRLGFYEPIRRGTNKIVYGDVDHPGSVATAVWAGAFSGVLGGCLGSPFYLVKTRMQSYSPVLPVGTQHYYRHMFDAFGQIYRKDGAKGLFRGMDAAIMRTGAGSSVQLPIYNYAKAFIEKHDLIGDGPAKHLSASAISGFGVCTVMQVFDTVMTRMYNQSGQLYKNPFDCFYKTVKAEGFLALYKGFGAHLLRVGPHTVLTLTFMEQTMKMMKYFEGM